MTLKIRRAKDNLKVEIINDLKNRIGKNRSKYIKYLLLYVLTFGLLFRRRYIQRRDIYKESQNAIACAEGVFGSSKALKFVLDYKLGNSEAAVRAISERLGLATMHNKNSSVCGERTFDEIYDSNYWGSDESRSGRGSTLAATETIRAFLPKLFKKYKIKSMLDVPCGDFNWMGHVDMNGVSYVGGDIATKAIADNSKKYGKRKNTKFLVLNIIKDKLPAADLIFCKDCLQHLSYESVKKAIVNFKRSGAKYLLVTSYPLTLKNWDIGDGVCGVGCCDNG